MQPPETSKRLSVRRVAMTFGIPSRTVSRAIACGDLPAIKTTTETGQERAYISYEDALAWIRSLHTEASVGL